MAKKTKEEKAIEKTPSTDTEVMFVMPKEVYVSEENKRKALQSSIFNLTDMESFYGNLLQQFTIRYTSMLPTAGITFNKKIQGYEIYINPNFFVNKLSNLERPAVLQHEIMHFTNKHLFRLPFLEEDVDRSEKNLFNIAGDMAINQFIQNLPKGCDSCSKVEITSPEQYQQLHPTEEISNKCPGKGVDVANWKLDDGSLFPTFKTMEEYYHLIKKESKKQKGNKNTKGNVNEKLAGYRPFDDHTWGEGEIDDETRKEMLNEAKNLLKRTIDKSSFSHMNVPKSIQDLLEEINVLAVGLNYKQILRNAIKRTASFSERENTWKRPNKRYGELSPGSKLGAMPKLFLANDSSGSISITEQNKYLRIIDEFLKTGSRNCILAFWHTDLYYKKPYKRGQVLDKTIIQSGGTDVRCVLEDIKKNKYDLSIVLTDGYYDNVDINLKGQEVIFIISEGGNQNHPLKHIGKTILLDKLK